MIIKIILLVGSIEKKSFKIIKKGIVKDALFLYLESMNSEKNKKNKKRPYRMTNVSFPPAKYGLYIAIIIIIACSFFLFIN